MKIKHSPIILTNFDKWVEIIAIIFLVATWLVAIYSYTVLPDIIPIHFDTQGRINGYGNKIVIVILPIIGTVIFMFITILNKHPHIFNYPVTITNKNREFQSKNATRMLRCLKVSISLLFCLSALDIYLSGIKKTTGINGTFLIFAIALINISVIYFIRKMFLNSEKSAT